MNSDASSIVCTLVPTRNLYGANSGASSGAHRKQHNSQIIKVASDLSGVCAECCSFWQRLVLDLGPINITPIGNLKGVEDEEHKKGVETPL